MNLRRSLEVIATPNPVGNILDVGHSRRYKEESDRRPFVFHSRNHNLQSATPSFVDYVKLVGGSAVA